MGLEGLIPGWQLAGHWRLWQEASVPGYVAFSVELLEFPHNAMAAFPYREQDGGCSVADG